MTPTSNQALSEEWQDAVVAGGSVVCRRVFKNGKITIQNPSSECAKISVIWLADLEEYHGEKQMSFQLVPGGIIEFHEPNNHENDFLDWIVLDHISGGNLVISQTAPAELLN